MKGSTESGGDTKKGDNWCHRDYTFVPNHRLLGMANLHVTPDYVNISVRLPIKLTTDMSGEERGARPV